MLTDSKKYDQIYQKLSLLRLAVGFLGQGNQAKWWGCNFLDATGLRFLQTTFPRTAQVAALRSTTEAACIVHDQALGRIGSFHLFRLPPALENQLEQVAATMDWTECFKQIENNETAMTVLKELADALINAPEGPVQVGVESRILTRTAIREIAAHYYSAFQDGIRCFPYFASDR